MKIYLLIGFLIAVTVGAHAESVVVKKDASRLDRDWTLQDLTADALKRNPRILAARAKHEAARARVNFFRNLPDPSVEYEYDRIQPSMDGEPMKSLSVRQEIPFPTKLALRRKMDRQEMDAQRDAAREVELTVIKDVREAYAKVFLADEKLKLARETQTLADTMAGSARNLYEANRATSADVLKAQAEATKVQSQVNLYQAERSIAVSLLASLVDRDPAEFKNLQIDPRSLPQVTTLMTSEDVDAKVRNQRPELQSYRSMFDKARTSYSLSKQELLPDIMLTYKREERDGKYSDGEWMGGVGITVPLWFWGKQIPEIQAAGAELRAAKAEYNAAENTALYEGRASLARFDAARATVKLYQDDLLPRAESALGSARQSYETGQGNFSEYLESFRMLREFQAEYAESLADLLVAAADLERSTGGESIFEKERQ